MTHQDLTEFPRMTAAQIREVLAAVEQRKHSNAPYPDCFVCGAPVADHLTGPWVGGEGEALRTVRPCGHRMTYNTETVEQIKREMTAEAATEATEPAEGNPVADALAAELHRRSVRLEELRPYKQPACLGCPAVQVHGEVIGLLGALGIALGGTVPGGNADEMGKAYYDAWRARQAKEGR